MQFKVHVLLVQPRALFCDWPEVMGPFFTNIWPGLETYLMDILHAIMRVIKHIPEDHPFRGTIMQSWQPVLTSVCKPSSFSSTNICARLLEVNSGR